MYHATKKSFVCVCVCLFPRSFEKPYLCLTVLMALTVSSDQSLDALASPLTQSVHHEEQQREDEEGGDAANDQPHSAGHRVK